MKRSALVAILYILYGALDAQELSTYYISFWNIASYYNPSNSCLDENFKATIGYQNNGESRNEANVGYIFFEQMLENMDGALNVNYSYTQPQVDEYTNEVNLNYTQHFESRKSRYTLGIGFGIYHLYQDYIYEPEILYIPVFNLYTLIGTEREKQEDITYKFNFGTTYRKGKFEMGLSLFYYPNKFIDYGATQASTYFYLSDMLFLNFSQGINPWKKFEIKPQVLISMRSDSQRQLILNFLFSYSKKYTLGISIDSYASAALTMGLKVGNRLVLNYANRQGYKAPVENQIVRPRNEFIISYVISNS